MILVQTDGFVGEMVFGGAAIFGRRSGPLLLAHVDHPVHGLDGVEPALPPAAGQILADPDRLQVLQRVQVGRRQPAVLQALVGGEPATRVHVQQSRDAIDGRRRNVLNITFTVCFYSFVHFDDIVKYCR